MSSFNAQEVIEKTVTKLRSEVREKVVLVAVSGGVDSATTAAILKKAGIQTRCIFIDTGFMRKNEREEALSLLKENNIVAEVLDAQERFFSALQGVSEPREKRLVFRNTYFEIIEKYLQEGRITFLAQGSQSKSDLLKRNYHNVCDNEYINSKVRKIEPLLGLSKTQIREMARELNHTKELAERIPFPGPGLLIRFGGEYTPHKLAVIQDATLCVDTFKKTHASEFLGCFQCFPYLCDGSPVTYINEKKETDLGSVMLIRAVTLVEGIYKPFILPRELFHELTEELMKIHGIARVCLDMTPKNGTIDCAEFGATIEYE